MVTPNHAKYGYFGDEDLFDTLRDASDEFAKMHQLISKDKNDPLRIAYDKAFVIWTKHATVVKQGHWVDYNA